MSSVSYTQGDLGQQRANQRGILLMIGAMTSFVGNDALAKLATGSMPVSQVIAIRGVFASLFVLGLIFASGFGPQFRRIFQWPVLIRGCMEVMVAVTSLVGLAHVPLGTATTVGQITPILLLASSAFLLEERVDGRRWLAVLFCFAGVILVAHPTANGLNLFILSSLACAVLTALRDLLTHRMGAKVPTLLATLGTTVVVSLAGFGGSAFAEWQPLTAHNLMIVMLGGLCLVGGHALVIAAYRGVQVSVVSPFRYSAIALAVIVGLVVFGDLPDVWTALGMVLITISGLYAAQREIRQRRAIEAALARDGGG
ncbi:DMT family transporter [Labrys okinawensis]|uniref:DMT family transporter n=1 Tax=Labrys okinawensis TaxID=346911 RepID=UPI0039BD6B13